MGSVGSLLRCFHPIPWSPAGLLLSVETVWSSETKWLFQAWIKFLRACHLWLQAVWDLWSQKQEASSLLSLLASSMTTAEGGLKPLSQLSGSSPSLPPDPVPRTGFYACLAGELPSPPAEYFQQLSTKWKNKQGDYRSPWAGSMSFLGIRQPELSAAESNWESWVKSKLCPLWKPNTRNKNSQKPKEVVRAPKLALALRTITKTDLELQFVWPLWSARRWQSPWSNKSKGHTGKVFPNTKLELPSMR